MPVSEQPSSPGPGVVGAGGGTVLYESQRTRVLRLSPPGVPANGVGGVIWKEALGPGAAARTGQERAILTRLAAVPGVPRLLESPHGETGFAVTDSGGVSLRSVPSAGRGVQTGRDVVDLVTFALAFTRVLAGVHEAGVVHKDINPANIVVAGEGGVPVLIDWEMATTFAEERPGFTHESTIVGTLAYLAPEQTGRTGRGVDARADLYALGATLYELATGAPPFGAGGGDMLALIHDQLAAVPVPAARVNPVVPAVLSEVIGRLLEKEPDRRYQSAQGLAFDLSRLQDTLTADGEVVGFVLGERDFPLRIAAPSRLVGRDSEITALRAAFAEAMGGGRRGVLVSGAPGVGKTVLIDELRSVVTAAGGWFVQGQFDQYRQDESTDGVGQAMQSLVRMLLAEPDEGLAKLRTELVEGVGPAAGVLAAMSAEMAVLLDVAPTDLATVEPRLIGGQVIQSSVGLLGVLASADRPLVMVIDDLQWASAFPLLFLDTMLLDEGLSGLLLVGAYRDNEVDDARPLAAMLSRWERLDATPVRLHLQNLATTPLSSLLQQMLRLAPDPARELADAIGARTGGNPYDTVELVDALRREGVLTAAETGWAWDSAKIRGFIGHGDVIELLTARITALPDDTVTILEVLACLGGSVEVSLLAVAADQNPTDVVDALAPALEDGLLVMVQVGLPAVRFRHDQVQQAVQARLPAATRRGLRLRLARRLATHPELEGPAAEQYLAAGPDETPDPDETDRMDSDERLRVVRLFQTAAAHSGLINRAQSERFLHAAVTLLKISPEPLMAGLISELLIEHHAALFDLVRRDDADAVFTEIEQRVAGPVERAPAVAVQVFSLVHRGRMPEAVDLGMRELARLGLVPPTTEALPAEVADGLELLDRWIAAGPQAGELDRPEPVDPRFLAVASLMERLLPAAYICRSPLTEWLALEAHRLWVEEGPNARLAASLALLPSLGITLRDDYAIGYGAARRVLRVCEARHYEQAAGLLHAATAAFGTPWFEPVEEVIDSCRENRERFLRIGEWVYASHTYVHALWATLDSAPTLDSSVTELAAASKAWARVDDKHCRRGFQAFPVLLDALRGAADLASPRGDAEFAEVVHSAAETGNGQPDCLQHVTWALAAALFDQTEQLERLTATMMPLLTRVKGLYPDAIAHLLRALALAATLQATPPPDRQAALDEFDNCREWLTARAVDAPDNFAHLVTWLDAERAWALADFHAAVSGFDAAMSTRASRRRPWHTALITERAGRCQLANGLTRGGTQLLAEARDRYAAWGASGKVTELDREFPLLPPAPISMPSPAGSPEPAVEFGQSMIRSSQVVDLLAVLQACQALSSETNLDRLRERLVEILTAMTGATAVNLLLWNDDAQGWFLPATDASGGAAISVDQAGESGLICLSAFRYVERTREPLLVPDATRDDRFARDRYLRDLNSCSLLVIPLFSRGAPRAMLLLENRLSRGVFTTDRLDAVQLIVGQLTVSLDNALAERFRSLVQRSSDLTLVSNRSGILSYVSAASTEVLGTEGTALTGRPAADLIHSEDRDAFLAWVGGPGLAGQMLHCRVVNTDGAPRWVEIRCTDLASDPAVAGTVLHLRDVTERQRLETDLRHAQKMESVGQLAAGVAHEINTPIQFVADNLRFIAESMAPLGALFDGYRQALEGAPGPEELDARREALATLGKEIDLDFLSEEIPLAAAQALDGTVRVATIVKAMKAFAHPGGEANTFTDLNEAIRNTLIIATSEIRPVADIVLDLADLPPVWANLGDINQAILNLIVNAAHAMGDAATTGRGHGTLTVRTRAEPDAIVIEIQDTGNGIPPEIADRVFEQFFTTKAVGIGTGQGLALAYTLIHDRHGGTITFNSIPNQGTTFTIRLPQQE